MFEWVGCDLNFSYRPILFPPAHPTHTVPSCAPHTVPFLLVRTVPPASPVLFPPAWPVLFPPAHSLLFLHARPLMSPPVRPVLFPPARPILFSPACPVLFPPYSFSDTTYAGDICRAQISLALALTQIISDHFYNLGGPQWHHDVTSGLRQKSTICLCAE